MKKLLSLREVVAVVLVVWYFARGCDAAALSLTIGPGQCSMGPGGATFYAKGVNGQCGDNIGETYYMAWGDSGKQISLDQANCICYQYGGTVAQFTSLSELTALDYYLSSNAANFWIGGPYAYPLGVTCAICPIGTAPCQTPGGSIFQCQLNLPSTYITTRPSQDDVLCMYSSPPSFIIGNPVCSQPRSLSPSQSYSCTPTKSPSISASASPSSTSSVSMTRTASHSVSSTSSPSASITLSRTATLTQTVTPSASSSRTNTVTASLTPISTATRTATVSPTSTVTVTPSATRTGTVTATATPTVTATASVTITPTSTVTPTATTTPTSAATETPTKTVSLSPSSVISPASSNSPVPSPSPTSSPIEPAVPCFGDVNCADADPCTIDLCTKTGCIHTLVPCNDNNPCTTDTCVGQGSCLFTPTADAATCEQEVKNCKSYSDCASCSSDSSCAWILCGQSSFQASSTANITTFPIVNTTTVFMYANGNISIAFPGQELNYITITIGSFQTVILEVTDLRLLSQSFYALQECTAANFYDRSECTVSSDCQIPTFNFLSSQATTIGVAGGAAAGIGGGCGCGVFAIVFVFYRRKKKVSDVDAAATAQLSSTFDSGSGLNQNTAYEFENNDGAYVNPLFNE